MATIEDVLKLHQDLARTVGRQLRSLREGPAASPEVLLRQTEDEVARAKARVEEAIRERDEAVRVADERVQARKQELAELEKRIKDLGRRKGPVDAPAEPAAPAAPAVKVKGKVARKPIG
jgi:phage shock protein A